MFIVFGLLFPTKYTVNFFAEVIGKLSISDPSERGYAIISN